MASAALELILTLKDEASGKLDDIKGKLGGVNVSALALGAGAVVAVGAFAAGLASCVKAAADEEIGIVRLKAAVDASGTSYDSVSGSIETYIAAATRKTGFDDGVQRESIARLTMTTGNYKTALDLMPLAMDLARAKGMDLTAASEIVGKVHEGNTGILGRYGIVLKEGATSQEALAAMQQKFGGQAEAYGNTFAGAQDKMSTSIGNLKETIGAALLPVLTIFFTMLSDLATAAIPQVEVALGFLKDNADIIIPVLAAMGTVILVAVIPPLIAWAVAAAAAAAATIVALLPVIAPIAAIGAAVALLAVAWKNDWGGIQEKTQAVFDFLQPYIETAMAFIQNCITVVMGIVRSVTETVLGAIQSFWAANSDAIMGIVGTAWAMIQNTVATVMAVIQGVITAIMAAIRGDWAGAWTAIQGVIVAVWDAIKVQIGLALDLIKGVIALAWAIIGAAATAAWDAIKTGIMNIWTGIVSGVTTAVDGVRLAMGNAWSTIHGAASAAFNNIKVAITTPIQDALGIIQGIIDSIIGAWQRLGSFHIPLPHFRAGTRMASVAGISFPIPDIGIDWYGRGLAPTVFSQPTLIGVGERGPEVVSVTPAGGGGQPGKSFSFVYNDYSGGGRAAFEQIAQKLEFRYRYGI